MDEYSGRYFGDGIAVGLTAEGNPFGAIAFTQRRNPFRTRRFGQTRNPGAGTLTVLQREDFVRMVTGEQEKYTAMEWHEENIALGNGDHVDDIVRCTLNPAEFALDRTPGVIGAVYATGLPILHTVMELCWKTKHQRTPLLTVGTAQCTYLQDTLHHTARLSGLLQWNRHGVITRMELGIIRDLGGEYADRSVFYPAGTPDTAYLIMTYSGNAQPRERLPPFAGTPQEIRLGGKATPGELADLINQQMGEAAYREATAVVVYDRAAQKFLPEVQRHGAVHAGK